jgi:HK97 family phage major capsid protein
LANHESVVGALPLYADGPQAVWVCHKTYYYTVMVRLILASGGTTAEEVVNGRRVPIFLGYPVVFSQVFPSSEANSQIPVVFGNMALGAMFGDRRAETIRFTDTAVVGGESLWERDQIGVRGTERFDVAVHGYGSDTVAGPICGLETQSS